MKTKKENQKRECTRAKDASSFIAEQMVLQGRVQFNWEVDENTDGSIAQVKLYPLKEGPGIRPSYVYVPDEHILKDEDGNIQYTGVNFNQLVNKFGEYMRFCEEFKHFLK